MSTPSSNPRSGSSPDAWTSKRDARRGRTAYLNDPDAKEQDLQDDLLEWYMGNEHGNPYIEPQNIGGGRVELVFPVNGDRFVVELKREQADASRESLRKYLGQTAAYQATSICVGMLVVLDLATQGLPAHLRGQRVGGAGPATRAGGNRPVRARRANPGESNLPLQAVTQATQLRADR